MSRRLKVILAVVALVVVIGAVAFFVPMWRGKEIAQIPLDELIAHKRRAGLEQTDATLLRGRR